MPTDILLRSPFSPEVGSGLLTSLVLFSDRVEVRRMGRCLRTVTLQEVERVSVSTWGPDVINLRLAMRSGPDLAGRVEGVLAWKYKLMELTGVRDAPPELPDPLPTTRMKLVAAA